MKCFMNFPEKWTHSRSLLIPPENSKKCGAEWKLYPSLLFHSLLLPYSLGRSNKKWWCGAMWENSLCWVRVRLFVISIWIIDSHCCSVPSLFKTRSQENFKYEIHIELQPGTSFSQLCLIFLVADYTSIHFESLYSRAGWYRPNATSNEM